ncbi:MAG: glycosyltransferase family 39 protein [Acidobacteria bacterium]|nr:glycosyltransferase family 39 protein [Acidobacteriota bacterium]
MPDVGELVRKNLRYFVIFSAAGVVLRLIFLFRFPAVVSDSFVYGDIAKNWLEHGVFGLSGPQAVSPTYIRLPGYPAFLALIFKIFGMEHYRAALFLQIFVDLGTCFLCADIALRLFGARPAKIAFLMASLCPFLANYSAAALTETWEVFFTALAFALAIRALKEQSFGYWAGCGAASAGAILVRPDGALVVIAIEVYLFMICLWAPHRLRGTRASDAGAASPWRRASAAGAIVALIAVSPLVPWTIRNWRVFHRFQPLAPRYANEEDEFVPAGFNRWVKTWIADYTSVEEIYWQEPGSPIDEGQLPSRAFDTATEKAETTALLADYNRVLRVTPELDRRFERLAAERIRAHPLRYYIRLPGLRILDMWLRPRTEMLPSDSRWWEFTDEPRWSVLAIGLAAISLFYAAAGIAGWLDSRRVPYTGLLLVFVVLRSAFLATLENPEPRYTLEMYPIVIVFAAKAIAGYHIGPENRRRMPADRKRS